MAIEGAMRGIEIERGGAMEGGVGRDGT